MKKLRILISCGPTREPLDPVRFISNYSTGTLGFALARACVRKGHPVTLAHGPIEVPGDLKVKKIGFETVLDLAKVLMREIRRADVLFMVAAVSDFKPLAVSEAKIKKGSRFLKLSLVQNPDVLKCLRPYKNNKTYIGFSLESKDLFRHSLRKLIQKDLDLIVAQKVTPRLKPFGEVSIDAMLIDREGRQKNFRGISKQALSRYLLSQAEQLAEEKAC